MDMDEKDTAINGEFSVEIGTTETSATPKQQQQQVQLLNFVNEGKIKKEVDDLLQGRKLLFPVDAIPPWYIVLLYALQQVLSAIVGPVTAAFVIHSTVCGKEDSVFLSELIGTSTFMSGLCTLLQVTFGVRLPVMQGSTLLYLPIISSFMLTPQWRCPPNNVTLHYTNETGLMTSPDTLSVERLWKPRMMEVTGALAVSASFQVFLGCSGLIGMLMRFIGPLTIAPAVTLIGFSLQDVITRYSSQHWGVSLSTAAVFIMVSQFLKNVLVPFPNYNRSRGFHAVYYPAFRLFPPIFAIMFGWILCFILTMTGQLPDQPGAIGYNARTDTKLYRIAEQKWFFIPYPGMWGFPTFSPGVLIGMLSATISTTVESIGDYYATARSCQVRPPPKHAMNRGIAMEGLGSVICGLLGAAHATTSYSTTIGFIPLTGMGSRVTWQVAGALLVVAGIFGKFGAILATIPEPILGGILIVLIGMVISVGLSNVQFVDMSTGRNMMILGTSLILGMVIPTWTRANVEKFQTGTPQIDQMLTILLGTPMFIGGMLGCLLDNILPGTLEERGMIAFQKHTSESVDINGETVNASSSRKEDIYDLPFARWCSCSSPWMSYVPFLPCYRERSLDLKKLFRTFRERSKV